VLGALSRLLPHLPNFTPIGAIALFGGCFIKRKELAYSLPLVILLLSDILIGFHSILVFVYFSFLLTVFIGGLIKEVRILNILGGALLSSILFYVITNFGVWVVSGMYEMSIKGLIECYVMALPFFRYEILGNIFYSGILFGIFTLLEYYIPSLRLKEERL